MKVEQKIDANTVILGGGCFWCLEAVFSRLKGVKNVVPGYAGGNKEEPTYEDVCSGQTGHAEVIKIEYDPDIISYNDLLSVFFAMHDPTTLNRQGADVGEQYRSVIFYINEEQKITAEMIMEKIREQRIFENPIVTLLVPLDNFFPAEDLHKQYFADNPYKPYCQLMIFPKIEKLRQNFAELME